MRPKSPVDTATSPLFSSNPREAALSGDGTGHPKARTTQ